MSYDIVIKPIVESDILNAVNYYKKKLPSLAPQFLIRIREAKTFIARYPLSFQIKYKKVRTLLLKQFPYHIHYIINEDSKQIIIIAIIHAYKNTRDYSKR